MAERKPDFDIEIPLDFEQCEKFFPTFETVYLKDNCGETGAVLCQLYFSDSLKIIRLIGGFIEAEKFKAIKKIAFGED